MKKILLAAVLMAAAGTASAGEVCFWGFCFEVPSPHKPEAPSHGASAPEIDPASALSGFALLAGSLIVLRGRRTKQSKE